MTIDWERQWEIHCPFFIEGEARIPLGREILRLRSGPGFGDLSHLTTRLMLGMMPSFVKGRVLIDIGCGSGVLGLAGLLMGAERVYAIDIDPEAIEHARENSRINGLESKISIRKSLPPIPTGSLILINMILSEQKEVLALYPFLREFPALQSGYLLEQRDQASALFHGQVAHEREEEGWMGSYIIPMPGIPPMPPMPPIP